VYSGDVTVGDARRAGRLTVTGSPELAQTVSKWMPVSSVAHVRPATRSPSEATSSANH